MYARVMSGQLSPGDIDKFTTMIRDKVIPRAQALGGFEGGYWLADRESGRIMGITMYESEQALRDSAEPADRIRVEVSREAGLPVPSFSSYEIIASVGGKAGVKAA